MFPYERTYHPRTDTNVEGFRIVLDKLMEEGSSQLLLAMISEWNFQHTSEYQLLEDRVKNKKKFWSPWPACRPVRVSELQLWEIGCWIIGVTGQIQQGCNVLVIYILHHID